MNAMPDLPKIKPARKLLILLPLLGIFLPQAVFSQPQIQFERALLLEEAQERWQEAIALYQQVVEESEDDALAAQAQFHIGICYEKLGQEEAAKAYQAVIDSYPGQGEWARLAQQRLDELHRASEPPSPSSASARKVWVGAPDMYGSVSPDGRYISFADWDTGNLGIHNLSTGESRNVTSEGTWESTPRYNFAETSHWSPDSRQLAYTRWISGYYELRLVGIDGTASRLLYRDPAVWGPYEGGWSPDGKSISLTLARNDNTHQLAVLSVADGSVRVLKTTDWRWPVAHEFSPDGRYFAFDFPPEETSPNRDIYLMAGDGSREVHLVSHEADEEFMGWTPDGDALFTSNRTGRYGLWMIGTRDGNPEGAPVLIQPNLGEVIRLGTTREGALYYGIKGGGGEDAFQVSFDPSTGSVNGDPEPVSERRLGRTEAPAWSPDGKSMAYLSRRGPAHSVVIRSLETGTERELPLASEAMWVLWSPDSQSLLLAHLLGPGQGFYRISLETPEREELVLETEVLEGGPPAILTEAGRTLIYLKVEFLQEENQRRIGSLSLVRRDLQSAQETILYECPDGDPTPLFAVSADGSQIAFGAGRVGSGQVIRRMAIQGGPSQDLAHLFYQDQPIEMIRPDSLVWTPDGRYLLFSGAIQREGQKTEQLWRIPATGGTPEPAFEGSGLEQGGPWGPKGPDDIRSLQMSPDGLRLGFTAFYDPITPDSVWVLEGFLPEPGGQK